MKLLNNYISNDDFSDDFFSQPSFTLQYLRKFIHNTHLFHRCGIIPLFQDSMMLKLLLPTRPHYRHLLGLRQLDAY